MPNDLQEIRKELALLLNKISDLELAQKRLEKTIGTEYFEGELAKFTQQAKIIQDRMAESGLFEMRLRKVEIAIQGLQNAFKKFDHDGQY